MSAAVEPRGYAERVRTPKSGAQLQTLTLNPNPQALTLSPQPPAPSLSLARSGAELEHVTEALTRGTPLPPGLNPSPSTTAPAPALTLTQAPALAPALHSNPSQKKLKP